MDEDSNGNDRWPGGDQPAGAGAGAPGPASPLAPAPPRPAVPPTHAGWAVASTLLFFPLAFWTWPAALDVTRLWVMDDFRAAQAASDKVKRLGKIALAIGVTIYVLYFGFIIAVVAVGIADGGTRTR